MQQGELVQLISARGLKETAKKNERSLEAEVRHAIRQNLDNATEPPGARPDLTVERTRAGLEAARQLSREGGRKRQMTDSKIESAKKLLANGVLPRDDAEDLGVSVPTTYRWLPASARL